ncbi:hypothetical protein PHISCL_04425 [Aspergillus sclerotialis]|uniref:Uncharacterized protein n=1 Tax=Aspergillus sclerotialis TaxID=2070753 RepID=A0A3A3A1M2_9EURO|nr:hypothetical protein PHISCL_04425 [Aspergillus sclerotialis]
MLGVGPWHSMRTKPTMKVILADVAKLEKADDSIALDIPYRRSFLDPLSRRRFVVNKVPMSPRKQQFNQFPVYPHLGTCASSTVKWRA